MANSPALEAARQYIRRGWAPIPIPHGEKGPRLREWQKLRLTAEQAATYFRNGENIGLLLGEPSGQRVCVDLDHPLAVELADQFLPPTPLIAGRAQNPRTHWFYKVDKPIQNISKKLPDGKKTTVEVLSNGKQVVVGPSIHPSGDVYDVVGAQQPAAVDAAELLEAVETLHRAVLDKLGLSETTPQPTAGTSGKGNGRPGDDFNERGDVRELLRKHDWQLVRGGDNEQWRRPGKDFGVSATLKDGKLFYVFSSSAGPFAPDRCYNPFAVFAALEHGGDFAAAAKDLRGRGFGEAADSSKSTSNRSSETATTADWPAPPAKEAFHGVTGGFVDIVSPHSEADPVALLIQFLVGVGNVLGRTAFSTAESARHHVNLFAVLVGKSAKGRKGSSWSHVRRLLQGIDENWTRERVVSGLSSGEGLIWQVHDKIEQQQPVKEKGRVVEYQTVEIDPGVSDKRLLVIEEEFAGTLKVMGREANTLSPTIRQAWDSGTLRTMTKNSPAKATDAHISIVGHITRDELRRNLSETEQTNGFGNRFLWVCVARSKSLPDGGNLQDDDLEPIRAHVCEAVRFASSAGKIDRTPEARKLWHEVYPRLSRDRFGLLGSMTTRAEAQVLRLSVLYAALDMSSVVKVEHLKAALAIWDYSERSAEYVFGSSLDNRTADTLLAELRQAPEVGLTRTEMLHNVFNKNKTAGEIAEALRLLHDNNLAHPQNDVDSASGRTVERWFATLTSSKS